MRIKVPATSANLGPGFDTLGMALQFYNYFEAHPAQQLSVELLPATCVDTTGLSCDPNQNLLAQAYQTYFQHRGTPVIPARLGIEAHIPLSRGLGSSSSAIIAGLFLADALHPEPVGKSGILPMAIAMEGHPDNVLPALLGGVQCCLSDGTAFEMTWPSDWGIIILIPPTPLNTHEARAVMPSTYSQTDAVENIRAMGAWIHAIENQDAHLFRYALRADRIHQPARGKLIPEFALLQHLIAPTPAIGCIISGSGSTLAVYTPSAQTHQDIQALLKNAPELAHCKVFSAKPDTEGAQLIR